MGVIGLGVMGSALALNFLDRGVECAGWDLQPTITARAASRSEGRLVGAESLADLVGKLRRPRRLFLMVNAGAPVDWVIGQVRDLLEPGDIVIDGGNSMYRDTQRRESELASRGLHFFGIGVSGGEAGARHGPSLMVGGPHEAWPHIEAMLTAIAATTVSGPCVSHLGPDGAGHFVKTVHNGIEYADMQLLAEAYHLLSEVGRFTPPQLADIFERWNRGPLESFLMSITAKIFRKKDRQNQEEFLIDKVLDRAGQKGTGRWTAETALGLGVAVPSITAAVDARIMSSIKPMRLQASTVLRGPRSPETKLDPQALDDLHDALYAAKITAYAQGLSLIKAASESFGWNIHLPEVLRIWKGGCIIRASLLNDAIGALQRNKDLHNLMLDQAIASKLDAAQAGWRRTLARAVTSGIPIPAMSASMAYYDSFRLQQLPQNLIQAQRDAFGGHTYVRADDPSGKRRHSNWSTSTPTPAPIPRR